MAKKEINHQAETVIFYRQLEKAWIDTQQNPNKPDFIINQIFKLASAHAAKKRMVRANKTYTFSHNIFTKNTLIKQCYRINNFGQLVIIPGNSFYGLKELSSCLMYS